ncbi:MAG TPA: hypothetical protein VI230_04540 [Ignavibacteriaceae bacterium]
MELIPILSTIILVATICTFILAVGAYILYKVRERRSEQVQYPPPSSVHAELVTPEESEYRQEFVRPEQMSTPGGQFVKTAPRPGVYPGVSGNQSVKPGYYSTGESEASKYERIKAEKTTGKKFLKYTSEGYVPTEEDKKPGVLKWR